MQSQTSKKTTGNDLATFQLIADFVDNLHNYFGNKIHSLSLYHRLVYKMSFKDDDLILRHIDVFKTFCVNNRNALKDRDINLISSPKIQISEKIYIDIEYIFKQIQQDTETQNVIWEYLLSISAYVDPENNAKQILELMKQGNANVPNLNLPSSFNPMEMVSSLMGSGEFGGMMSTLQQSLENGNLDLSKLMPLVQSISKEIVESDDPTIKNLVSSLTKQME